MAESRPALLVRTPLAQLHEEPVGLPRMHPREVWPAVIHAGALALEPLDRARDVRGVEADEVDALAVHVDELGHGGRGIRRLKQLDVADAQREDRVDEAELLRFAALVHL